MNTGPDLAALLYIRLNRPLPAMALERLIQLGLAREVGPRDASASLRAHGTGYALTEQGRQLLDNTTPDLPPDAAPR